jgi:hypothetical protein
MRNFGSSKGYAQVTVTTTAQTLAELLTAADELGGAIPEGADVVWIQPETTAIRFRADGTAPTSSVGWPIAPEQGWPVGGKLEAIELIAASSVTVNLEFQGG